MWSERVRCRSVTGCRPWLIMRSRWGDSNWPASSAEVRRELSQVLLNSLQEEWVQEVMTDGSVQFVVGKKAQFHLLS